MTEQELQEIEARAEAATPGTVRWMKVRSHGFGITLDVDTMPNAELIANGRQWVLALVAEVRRLREALGFYADKANWRTTSEGFAAQYDPRSPRAIVDGGINARLALMSQQEAQKP